MTDPAHDATACQLGSETRGASERRAGQRIRPKCSTRVDPPDAAPLTDAGLTSHHAVKRSLDVLIPDAAALVIGVGGLGQMSLAYLRQLTGGVTIAADRSAAAHEMAAELGADLVLVSDEHTAEAEAIAWMLARIGSFAIDCTRDFDL